MATRKTHRSVNIQSTSQSSQVVPAVATNSPDWATQALFAMLQSFATTTTEGAPGLRVFTPARRVPETRALENSPSVAEGSGAVRAPELELPIVPMTPVHTPPPLQAENRVSPKSLQQVSAEVRSALAARRGRHNDDGQAGHEAADEDESVVEGPPRKRARTVPSVASDTLKRQTKSKAKAKAKAKSKSTVVPPGARGKPEVFSRQNPPTMPKLGQVPPIEYCGCRVYSSAADKKWRVLPRPGKSLYDKSFLGAKCRASRGIVCSRTVAVRCCLRSTSMRGESSLCALWCKA